MASQGDPTRVGGGSTPPPPAPAAPAGTGIELTTLFLSAVASAAAAYITSKIWARGTLFSAAMSPVIVALVKEGLRKPTEKVATVATAVPVAYKPRWTRTGADEPGLVAEPDPTAPPTVHGDPDAPHVVLPPVAAAETGPVRVYSTRARRMRWRLAVITGLLGFGIAVLLYTVPELIAGKAVTGSHRTTIFGGPSNHTNKTKTTTSTTPTTSTATTPTTTDPTKTVTQTQTVTTPAPSTTPATPQQQTPTATTQTPTTAAPPPAAVPQQDQVPPAP